MFISCAGCFPVNSNKVTSIGFQLPSVTNKNVCLCFLGQSSRTVSSSTSIESLSGGRGQSTASPPLPPSRGSDVSTSSPPLSATKKESFFNITRSRSHSKTMGKKEMVSLFKLSFSHLIFSHSFNHNPFFVGFPSVSNFLCLCLWDQQEEDLEAQVSFLQGQINDLEAMSKYCAKMMNTHICKFSHTWLHGLKKTIQSNSTHASASAAGYIFVELKFVNLQISNFAKNLLTIIILFMFSNCNIVKQQLFRFLWPISA